MLVLLKMSVGGIQAYGLSALLCAFRNHWAKLISPIKYINIIYRKPMNLHAYAKICTKLALHCKLQM